MEFASDDDRTDIAKIIDAFQRFCVGEVNITYDRCVFNRRIQETGESFDAFLSDVRRLAKSCDFSTLEDSFIRDRIVVGVRDNATRRKMLQTRKLDLNTAIDICRASEVATRQLKMMTGDERCTMIRCKTDAGRKNSASLEDVEAKSINFGATSRRQTTIATATSPMSVL
jgi:hypothetical protein